MSNNIEEKIAQLPPEARAMFQDRLWVVANHKSWLERNGINPTNPDIKRVKQVLYDLEYAHLLPQPDGVGIKGYRGDLSKSFQEPVSQ